MIDLLWQTDELRWSTPEPTDEARNAIYYLEGLSAGALPDVLEELRDRLAPLGVDRPPTYARSRFGTWIGGDRDGNPYVTPATTREVLTLQYEHGIRLLRSLVDRLRRELSVSDPSLGLGEIAARIGRRPAGLPEVEPRYRRLNAEEPYRLKLTCVESASASPRSASSTVDGTSRAATTPTTPSCSPTCCCSTGRVLTHQGRVTAPARSSG